jgi:hypothetical protein
VTLTRSQIHDRLGALRGELLAAREQKRLTADAKAVAERQMRLAEEADAKADQHIERLEGEARELAGQYAAAVDELIAEPSHAALSPDDLRDAGLEQGLEGAWRGPGGSNVEHYRYQPDEPADAEFVNLDALREAGEQRLSDAFDRATDPAANGEVRF